MEMQKIKFIEKRIKALKLEIVEVGDIRSGSLSTQYNVCGTMDCKCKDKINPKKHGPYYQLSFYNEKKKHTTCFVTKDYVKKIEMELQQYKKMKDLIEEWIQLSNEISVIKIKIFKKESQKISVK